MSSVPRPDAFEPGEPDKPGEPARTPHEPPRDASSPTPPEPERTAGLLARLRAKLAQTKEEDRNVYPLF